MYAVKCGWVGQTFALAKRNESEGRKSRIRRSKEERKAMVESFIKKYQDSNKGNFPSLNLTHKEVGGSFYTVREIVRDIIQENRVLGPAKFTLEEHASDQFLEQGRLGSIARDIQTNLVASLNENHLEPDNLQDTSEKLISGHYTGAECQMFDNGNALNGGQVDVRNQESVEAFDKRHVINGSDVDETNKESVEASTHESQVSEPLAPPKNVEQDLVTPIANVSALTADVIVETFPLRPVPRTASRIESFGEFRDLSNSPEKEMQILELEKDKELSELNSVELKNSDLFDEKSVHELGNIMVNNKSVLDDEEKEKNVGHTVAESTKQAALEEYLGHEFEVSTDPQVKAPHQSIRTSESIEQSQIKDRTKTSVQDGFHTKNLTNAYTGESKRVEESLENVDDHIVDSQLGSISQKINNPTLDRINLESWDGMPKNSVKQEPNPLFAIFRAFVDALVKFWSE